MNFLKTIVAPLVILLAGSGCEKAFKTQYGDTELEKRTVEAKKVEEQSRLIENVPCNTAWGEKVPPGGTVIAFSATSTCEESCTPIKTELKCKNGELRNNDIVNYKSYIYKSCTPNICRSCKPGWGGVVSHGDSVEGFQAEQVACGLACGENNNKKDLFCNDGSLEFSGASVPGLEITNFKFGSCLEATCPCDFPWNPTNKLPHGETLDAYDVVEVGCGQSCETPLHKQNRFCNNGTLEGDGSFSFESCIPQVCSTCNFNGQPIPHEGTVLGYQKAIIEPSESCTSKTLTCLNGAVAEQALFPAASCAKKCQLNWIDHTGGAQITLLDPGENRDLFTANKVPCNETNETLRFNVTCDAVSGNIIPSDTTQSLPANLFAAAPAVCLPCEFNGTPVADGDSTGFRYTAGAGTCTTTCENIKAQFICSAGVLKKEDGTPTSLAELANYTENSCFEDCVTCNVPKSDGTTTTLLENGFEDLATKDSVLACEDSCTNYFARVRCKAQTAPSGDRSGLLVVESQPTGADFQIADLIHSQSSCVEKKCPCTLPWATGPRQTIDDGDSVPAHSHSTVNCNSECTDVSIPLVCDNGNWIGDTTVYNFENCSKNRCRDCDWHGIPVLHDNNVTGYEQPIVPSAQSCQASTLTCNDGSFLGAGAFPFSKCDHSCELAWNDFEGNPQLETLNPSETRTFFTVNELACGEGGAQYAVEVVCDPLGTGNLGLAAGAGAPPGPLFGAAPENCSDCEYRGGTLAGGEQDPTEYFATDIGNCAQTCDQQKTKFRCVKGELKTSSGSVATPAILSLYAHESCDTDCVRCDVALSDGTTLTLAEGGKEKLANENQILNCEDSCSNHEAVVVCEKKVTSEGLNTGELKIESAINKSLTVPQLTHLSCEKPEGIRCTSGGNPPRGCAMPGEFDYLQLSDEARNSPGSGPGGRVFYYPRVERNWYTLVDISVDPNPYLAYLTTFKVLGKDQNYGVRTSRSPAYSWRYQVSPDTVQTFYDIPVVDQRLNPGDDCDKHSLAKTCDPNGYWVGPDEVFGDRGGIGPYFEPPSSRPYKYLTCETIKFDDPGWSSRLSHVDNCLTPSNSPASCLFEKSPFFENSSQVIPTNIDSLQNYSINWFDSAQSYLLRSETFRVYEYVTNRISYCEKWQTELQPGDDLSTIPDEDLHNFFLSRRVYRDIYQQFYSGDQADVDLRRQLSIPDEGVSRIPASSSFDGPFHSNLINNARTYPAARSNLYYSLVNFQKTLQEKFGVPLTYFGYQPTEVIQNEPLYKNNAGFAPELIEGYASVLVFGPKVQARLEGVDVKEYHLEPYSVDQTVTAHELGHANFYYANKLFTLDKNSVACGGGSRGSCCESREGCYLAIHEGQADFLSAMLFPESPAIGDGIQQNTLGLSSCGIVRDPSKNRNLTFDQAYSACTGMPGEVHVMGNIYASIWWELRASQLTPGLKTELEKIYLEHLKYINGTDTFFDLEDAVFQAELSLFGSTRGYATAFRNEVLRRGGFSRSSPNFPPVISFVPNMVLGKNSAGARIDVFVTDSESPSHTLGLTASSTNTSLISPANISVEKLKSNRTLYIKPTAEQTGNTTITLTVSDGFTSSSINFSVTVNEFSGIPTRTITISVDQQLFQFPGVELHKLIPGVLPTDSIVVLEGLKMGRISPPEHRYLPEFGFTGLDDMVVQVSRPGLTENLKVIIDVGGITDVNSVAEFDQIRNNFYGKFEIKDDIDFANVSFEPIGSSDEPFLGTILGAGKTLSNINVNGSGENVGIFSYFNGSISKLNFENIRIVSNAKVIGGFAAQALREAVIKDVKWEGLIAGGWTVGGLIGENAGLMTRSRATAKLVPMIWENSGGTHSFSRQNINNLYLAGGSAQAALLPYIAANIANSGTIFSNTRNTALQGRLSFHMLGNSTYVLPRDQSYLDEYELMFFFKPSFVYQTGIGCIVSGCDTPVDSHITYATEPNTIDEWIRVIKSPAAFVRNAPVTNDVSVGALTGLEAGTGYSFTSRFMMLHAEYSPSSNFAGQPVQIPTVLYFPGSSPEASQSYTCSLRSVSDQLTLKNDFTQGPQNLSPFSVSYSDARTLDVTSATRPAEQVIAPYETIVQAGGASYRLLLGSDPDINIPQIRGNALWVESLTCSP